MYFSEQQVVREMNENNPYH